MFSTVVELLSDIERWVKGHYAVNKAGIKCSPAADVACKWCLMGAVAKIYGINTQRQHDATNTLIRVLRDKHGRSIVQWHDVKERTHEEVLELAKQASI